MQLEGSELFLLSSQEVANSKPGSSRCSAPPVLLVLVPRHTHFFLAVSTCQSFHVIWLLLMLFPLCGISCFVDLLQGQVKCLSLILFTETVMNYSPPSHGSKPSASLGVDHISLPWSDSAVSTPTGPSRVGHCLILFVETQQVCCIILKFGYLKSQVF